MGEHVYESVKRCYVRNYDSWKYCAVLSNVSNIFHAKMTEILYQIDGIIESAENRSDELDALYFELRKYAKMNELAVDCFMQWLRLNEYDQESIVDDIVMFDQSSNILGYFTKEFGAGYSYTYYHTIRNWCESLSL